MNVRLSILPLAQQEALERLRRTAPERWQKAVVLSVVTSRPVGWWMRLTEAEWAYWSVQNYSHDSDLPR